MEIIQNWFEEGCDYTKGIVIYGNLPKHSPLLLKTFQKKNNSFNSEKLKYELKKFVEKYKQTEFVATIQKAIIEVTKPVPEKVSEKEQKNAVLFHQLPESLRPVLLEATQLFKENCLLKVNLNELPAHAEKAALELQIKIHTNFKKNELCWQKIDLYLEKRIVPEAPKQEFEGLTPAGMLRQQQLLYASISKLNTRLKINREQHSKATIVAIKSKIERQIIKQEENLLQQNEKLIIISGLIDGN
ncbi:hypothetical protein RT99_05950 [Flavobacterium sp. MEB061]|uniref:hypothetical protein n=1 Tax=Flavobacterium sp. MEB061 TaxID=1587524 RepID=UPI0005ACE6FF|nr:hypothetical protein [Flavobacterium sp. MEB061]KIQ22649.1 hypothetical protein RT99_05950 [Flavobacterium sp. MEB061]